MRRKGQGLVEYALILVVIGVVLFAVFNLYQGLTTKCAEGFIWSYQAVACIPGYRP